MLCVSRRMGERVCFHALPSWLSPSDHRGERALGEGGEASSPASGRRNRLETGGSWYDGRVACWSPFPFALALGT